MNATTEPGDAAAARVIEVVAQFAAEARPGRAPAVALDSSFERELGLDSLARVELLLRAERAFGVSLPERALNDADTPRALLGFVLAAHGAPQALADRAVQPLAAGDAPAPAAAGTLLEALDWHVAQHAGRVHICLYGEDEATHELTYGELADGARAVAAGLLARGLEPRGTVAIMLPTGADYFFSFFGILMAGGVPVPIYPPLRLSQIEDHLRRHVAILANAGACLLITVPEAKPVARLLGAQLDGLKGVVTVADLQRETSSARAPAPAPDDLAFLQYTSGSTGTPKGVMLTHANLLANIRAMGAVTQAGAGDVAVSWLPLYHDMGLIGAWLGSLYLGMPLVLMSPLAFLTRPQRWLWAIHRHRGTLSAAPNFAYELCTHRIDDAALDGLDLSSWRFAFNGAEPVSPVTIENFQRRFARYGFRAETMAPVYGLAESSVGLALRPPGRGPVIDRIERDAFVGAGNARPAAAGDGAALQFVGCGTPLPDHAVRVLGEDGAVLGERRVGRLEFRGPSATRGYYRNAEATRALFNGEWLDSGDYAYLADGEIFLTGRVKDMIIRGGRNIYPYELEQAVGAIPGIRRGCVAVFGSTDRASGTERLIVLAETRERDAAVRERLRRAIADCALDVLGQPADDIVLAPPHTVLKTSSGKIRRAASRDFYESGGRAVRPAPVWLQFLRLAGAGVLPQLRRFAGGVASACYTLYAWLLFALIAPPAWCAVALLGRPRLARPLAHVIARAFLLLAGMRLSVRGRERLPAGDCVLAANHASYLDGIVLAAALPATFPHAFVAKRELAAHWLPRLFLRALGAEFVERFDAQRSVADAGQVARAFAEQRAPVFFAEGTFDRRTGLKPFRSGAFAVAARAGAPVVPVAIRGARALLRDGEWCPHPGAVEVVFCAPVAPAGGAWGDVARLRDAVRAEVLAHCGEPDLAD